jgi:hypothetical protein
LQKIDAAWAWSKARLEYLDIALAIGLGVVFTLLGILDVVSQKALTQAAIGLLAVLAFSLLRDRVTRERSEEVVTALNSELRTAQVGLSTTVSAIERLQADLGDTIEQSSSSTFHTKWLELRYEFEEGGAVAKAKKTREVQFTRNNVPTLFEYSASDGRSTAPTTVGGPKGGNQSRFENLSVLRDDRGRAIQLFSLGRLWKRGEEMVLLTERTLIDCFRDGREYIHFEADGPIDEVTFHVRWPGDNPPQSLEIIRENSGKIRQHIPLDRLEQDPAGRPFLRERITGLNDDEEITLFWQWNRPGVSAGR